MRERLTRAQARRTVLAAQGFGARPDRAPTMRDLQRTIDAVALFQIDSVNVLTRAHLMPMFSRWGDYDPTLLKRAAERSPRRLFEYWAHEAALVDVALQPALRFRMARAAEDAWGGMLSARANQVLMDRVLVELADGRALTARQLETRIEHQEERSRDNWGWNWSMVKRILEYLFWSGRVSAAGRTEQFERRYALPERVLPAEVLDQPDPDPEASHRLLAARAVRALGVADESSVSDYFRLKREPVRAALAQLAEAGELHPVVVAGHRRPCFLAPTARFPRRIRGRALLAPFDPLVFDRERLLDLFDLHYRIEIYTPAEKRRHGYYVLPFLLDEEFVARVDLKADRARSRLVVRSAWWEPGRSAARERVLAELRDELRLLADWQHLECIEVEERGDLAAELSRLVAAR